MYAVFALALCFAFFFLGVSIGRLVARLERAAVNDQWTHPSVAEQARSTVGHPEGRTRRAGEDLSTRW
jgi:hypothetical protein